MKDDINVKNPKHYAENGVKFSNDALDAIRLAEQYKDQLSREA